MFGVQKSPGLSDAHTLRPLSFYVKLGGREEGPYRTEDLRHLPGFTLQTLVREPSSNEWKPAYLALDLSRYFARPTPLNSFTAANSKNEISQLMSARKALRYSGTRWDLRIILFSMILWIGAFSFYQGSGQATCGMTPRCRRLFAGTCARLKATGDARKTDTSLRFDICSTPSRRRALQPIRTKPLPYFARYDPYPQPSKT